MFLKFLSKLTLLSKIILGFLLIIIISAILCFCFSFYKLSSNQYLLNTRTGDILSQPRTYLRSPWVYTKFNNDVQHCVYQTIVKNNTENLYILKICIYYTYDLNWIKQNKKLPEIIKIPDDIFASYLNNSYCEYSLQDLNKNQRQLQFNIIKNFLDILIKDKGYIITKIVIPYPLLNFKEWKELKEWKEWKENAKF